MIIWLVDKGNIETMFIEAKPRLTYTSVGAWRIA